MDGFDHHSAATLASMVKWALTTNFSEGSSDTYRRFTGIGQYLTVNSNTAVLERVFGANEASGIFGLAFRVIAGAAYQISPFILYDTSTIQMAVILNDDRTFSITRGSTVLATSTYQVTTGVWTYLELKWKIADSISSGDVVLYADGVAIITLSAAVDTKNTANAYATKVRIGRDSTVNSGVAPQIYIDDFYWFDLTGSNNNAVKGPVRIVTLAPSGNGNSSQLVNNSGNSTNNYTRVDETPPNSDTDYVETSTTGNKDTYAYGDLPSTTNTIHAIAINTVAKKTDAAARTFKNQTRLSGTDYEGAEVSLNTSYTNHQEVVELNPATTAAWTKSEIDGAEFGTKCHA